MERDTGIPAELTQQLIDALAGADHLGSLLKIDAAVDEALANCELFLNRSERAQGDPYSEDRKDRRLSTGVEEAKATMLSRLELFLHAHSHGEDLGLKLKGEQLAAGVRFVRLLQEGVYDLVVANPPYQGTSKMVDSKYIEKQYPLGKADLYAAFLLRGLQLVRSGGVSAMLTMRNWLFIHDYRKLRPQLLKSYALTMLGDFDRGAFEDVPDEVVSVAVSVFGRHTSQTGSVAMLPTPRRDRSRDSQRTQRKRAATLVHVDRHKFDPGSLKVVPEWPLVHWWDARFLANYASVKTIGAISPARQGMATANNTRFLRRPWEVDRKSVFLRRLHDPGVSSPRSKWTPYIKGAAGRLWVEPVDDLVLWHPHALAIKLFERNGKQASRPQNDQFYFKPGVAFTKIGAEFSARAYRYRSVFDVAGSSVFMSNTALVVSLMNSSLGRSILESLNPTVNFQVGDVNRLPLFPIPMAEKIFCEVERAFTDHESHREASVEFECPGPSPWRHAQDWAQLAVDRPEGDPLPPCAEELDPEPPMDHVSFAVGVALGRFGANGEGILDSVNDLPTALPSGICFLDGSLEKSAASDSLGHGAADLLHAKWTEHGPAVAPDTGLRSWLRRKFFGDVHKSMYEKGLD